MNDALTATSDAAYACGFRVLKGCCFGLTDEAHVAVLLGFMAAAAALNHPMSRVWAGYWRRKVQGRSIS
ncbi:hypothetical protein [Belnapia sp. F-4-1]|uniref:hypothetical protein n=1 Tax=Belnapia sp. F-4-1 TaxID=1545443 RepID=UPI0011858539|nr:hypothetical protein [Belnapia sp. F-4-1]